MKLQKSHISAICILLVAAIVGTIAGMSFYAKRHFKEDIFTGEGVSEVIKLSQFNENLVAKVTIR